MTEGTMTEILRKQVKENVPFEMKDSYWAKLLLSCPYAEGTCCDDAQRKVCTYWKWQDNKE